MRTGARGCKLKDMIGCARTVFTEGSWRSAGVQLAYLSTGGVLGLGYAALPIVLDVLGVRSVAAWAPTCVLVALMVCASGFVRPLRDLDRGITNLMLGTAIPAPSSVGSIDTPPSSRIRRILGLTPGYTAWRATFWFFFRSLFGLLTLTIVAVIVMMLPLAVALGFSAAGSSSATAVLLSIIRILALAAIPFTVLLYLARVWIHGLSVLLLADAAPELLGPSPTEQVAELQERLRRMSERDRLGRMLHNTVGRALTGIVRQAAAASKTLRSEPEFTHQALSDIETVGRAAREQINNWLARQHEDSVKMPPPTRVDLDGFLRLIRRQGVPVSTDISEDFDALPGFLREEVYDVAQEGCYNALNHAAHAPTHLTVAIRENELEVSIENEAPVRARSAAGVPGARRGLRDLAHRVEVLNGRFEAGPCPGGGFRLRVLIPLPPTDRRAFEQA